jgi:hypothetical protein
LPQGVLASDEAQEGRLQMDNNSRDGLGSCRVWLLIYPLNDAYYITSSGPWTAPQGTEGGLVCIQISGTDGASSSSTDSATPSLMGRLMEPVKAVMVRGTVYFSFLFAKQPARIEQVRFGVYCNETHR